MSDQEDTASKYLEALQSDRILSVVEYPRVLPVQSTAFAQKLLQSKEITITQYKAGDSACTYHVMAALWLFLNHPEWNLHTKIHITDAIHTKIVDVVFKDAVRRKCLKGAKGNTTALPRYPPEDSNNNDSGRKYKAIVNVNKEDDVMEMATALGVTSYVDPTMTLANILNDGHMLGSFLQMLSASPGLNWRDPKTGKLWGLQHGVAITIGMRHTVGVYKPNYERDRTSPETWYAIDTLGDDANTNKTFLARFRSPFHVAEFFRLRYMGTDLVEITVYLREGELAKIKKRKDVMMARLQETVTKAYEKTTKSGRSPEEFLLARW